MLAKNKQGRKVMINVLKKEELLKLYDGSRINGYVLLRGFTKQPTKNGGEYIAGSLEAQGTIQFKSWGNSEAFSTLEHSRSDFENKICHVRADVNIYNGMFSLIIQEISLADMDILKGEGVQESDFISSPYNVDVFWKEFENTFKKNTSESVHELFDEIFSGAVKSAFLTEFAAISHHDNCRTGLLAHSTKVVKIATIIKMYPNILKRVGKDLLFLGAAVHDLGKVMEYNNGTISNNGKMISHTVSGVILLEENYKELIVKKMGTEFYMRLVSIVSCHHGEYGEPPRTVEAYVLHIIDTVEAQLTSINQMLEGVSIDQQIVMEGMKLS